MKNYILINPFTNKPIHFSSFLDENFIVAKTSVINQQTVIEHANALCIEVPYDSELLNKTYNPTTGSFVD